MNEMQKPVGSASPAISRASFKPLKECATLEEAFETREFRDRIEGSVPQHVQPQRMLRTFITAANRTPLLYQASVRSFVGACLTLSQVGLEPNTPLGNAYLIPFKQKKWNPRTRQEDESVEINVIFGYTGLLDLSYRTGLVKSVHADVVYPGHEFSFEYGTDAHLRHKPTNARDPNAAPLYAYMHASLRDGQAFEVMPYDDVLAIRNKSQGYRYALTLRNEAEEKKRRLPAGWTEAPWVAHEIAMARKTAFRAGSKWLPRSVELATAIALDEAQDRRRSMDFSSVLEAPTIDGKADYLGAAADAALASDEEAPPVDPGTAHAIRQQEPDPQPQPEKKTRPVGKAAEKPITPDAERMRTWAGEATRVQSPSPEPPADDRFGPPAGETPQAPPRQPEPEPETDFAATLVDANGDPSHEVYTDPLEFARAYAAQYKAANAEAIDALADYNADALSDAAALSGAAQQLLEKLTEPPPPPVATAVEPPVERGKVYWPGYVKLLKAASLQLSAATFPAWAEAQQDALMRCAMGQRPLAVRVIADAAGFYRCERPAWLAGLLKAKEPPTDAGEAPPDPDVQWVDERIAYLDTINTLEDFTNLVAATPLRTVMARLRRDKPDLFERADIAFADKKSALGGDR